MGLEYDMQLFMSSVLNGYIVVWIGHLYLDYGQLGGDVCHSVVLV